MQRSLIPRPPQHRKPCWLEELQGAVEAEELLLRVVVVDGATRSDSRQVSIRTIVDTVILPQEQEGPEEEEEKEEEEAESLLLSRRRNHRTTARDWTGQW